MKFDHTPGPWEVSGANKNFVAGTYSEKTESVVAEIWGIRGHSPSIGDWKANARLIAAAPEMLEALIEECFTCGGICEIKKCDNCHRKSLLERATGQNIEEILKGE